MKENLNDLIAFMAVAREQSFTRAAAGLGVSQSALSQTLRNLEERLDLKLLNRTTRSVTTTEAGDRLLELVGPALDDIDAGLAELHSLKGKPAGTVRITADEFAVSTVLWPALQPLLRDHPDIKVELSVDYGLVDIAKERFDAGVRRAGLIAKDMIAVPICPPVRMVVVGSPDYFNRHTPPQKPQDLVAHNAINLRLPTQGGVFPWLFQVRKKEVKTHTEGQLVFNSILQVLQAAKDGMGLAYLPEALAQPGLDDGSLISVLDRYSHTFPGYHLYYTSRRKASTAFAMVVDALRLT